MDGVPPRDARTLSHPVSFVSFFETHETLHCIAPRHVVCLTPILYGVRRDSRCIEGLMQIMVAF